MSLKKYYAIALSVIMVMALFMGSSIVVAQQTPPEYTSGLHTGWMTENYTDWTNSTWTCNRTFEYYIPTSYNGQQRSPCYFRFMAWAAQEMRREI
jgi:hypothetical protein